MLCPSTTKGTCTMAMVMITEACVLVENKDLMTNHFLCEAGKCSSRYRPHPSCPFPHVTPPPTPHSHRWGGVGCHIGSIHADGVGNCCMWACVLVLCGYIGSRLGMWEHTRLVSRTIITCDDGYPVVRHDIQGNSCVTLATWGRVDTSDSNTTVMWTLVFEWYVVKCRSKNGHQKDMCLRRLDHMLETC